MGRLLRDPARRVFICVVFLAMLSITSVLAAVILVVVARYSFVAVSLAFAAQTAMEMIFPWRILTFVLVRVISPISFVAFHFPVLIEFSILTSKFSAESSL